MEFNWKAGGRRGRDTLEQTGTFAYSGEGWGLCHDGDRLVMSDGSKLPPRQLSVGLAR